MIVTAGHLRSRLRESPAPEVRPRSSDRPVLITLSAVIVAFALFLMPSQRHDYNELWIAVVLGVCLIGLAVDRPPLPSVANLVVPLGYIALVALLRDAAGGGASGFGGLFLLPVLWLALTAGPLELVGVLLAMVLAQLAPLVLIGAPWYPSSGWRSIVVFTSAAAITGAMVQRLVGETRRRATLLEQQAKRLEHATAQLAAQNERLQEVDRLKDDFIAVLSHELRTPLTSISGYLELALDAKEEPIPPKRREQLSVALRNAERLKALVNQILFFARIEAQPSRDRHPLDLAAIAQDAADTARVTAEAKTIELSVETDPPPLPVLGDRTQISQLLDNLVSNAVKFTPAGGKIQLRVHRCGDAVLTEVSDNGTGIPPDELPHVFERFYRTRSATAQAIAGSGLGLAISQLIAEAHNTTITVESTPGRRTTFSFALPIDE